MAWSLFIRCLLQALPSLNSKHKKNEFAIQYPVNLCFSANTRQIAPVQNKFPVLDFVGYSTMRYGVDTACPN